MQLLAGRDGRGGAFFAFLIAGPGEPVRRTCPTRSLDGPGPNPLLQNHLLMIIHPPMLYLGYVGMTIPFGIAVGALLRGELGDAWLVPLRKWTARAVDLPDHRHHPGRLVGVRGAGLGRLLGLGPGRERLVACRGSRPPPSCTRPWCSSGKKMLKLWTLALVLAQLHAHHRRHLHDALRSLQLGARLHPVGHRADVSRLHRRAAGLLDRRCWPCAGTLLVAESSSTHSCSREAAILLNNLVFAALTFVVLARHDRSRWSPRRFQGKQISVGEPYFNQMALPLGPG